MPAPRSDIGPIEDYLRDATQLPPSVVRPEQLLFEVTTTAQGVINTQTANQRVEPEYIFVLRRIRGYVDDPANHYTLMNGLTVQVQDQGRGRGGIWNNAFSMAHLTSTSGPMNDAVWDGFYAFAPGADVEVIWTVIAARLGANAIIAGVSLMGDLVRVRELDDGTLIIPGVTDSGAGIQRR